jgi:hypothetical protein
MLDEETQVTPPSTTAATQSQPSSRPSTKPGVKLNTASSAAIDRKRRRCVVSSSAVYSRPIRKSSRITPSSAVKLTNSPLNASISSAPTASPASR